MRSTIKRMLERINLLNIARRISYGFVRLIQWCQYITNINTHVRNVWCKTRGAPDGYPFPSLRMVYLVTGQHRLDFYYHNGALGAECIQRVLTKNRLQIQMFNRILDFGCGCGRVMRHWSTLKGPRLYGIDYNPYPIDWCQKTFSFAEFSVNHMQVPLDYNVGQFDFIYAISVFTHLSVKSQHFWISELLRVLKPGGYLYLTTHGKSYLQRLTLIEQELFVAGHVVVREERFNGNNICSAIHPESYVRQVLAKGFAVVDFIPEGANDAKQDVFLLQKLACSKMCSG